MATATVGALRVVLGLDSGAFTEGLSAAQKRLGEAGAKMQRIGAGMATVGAGLSAAITGPLLGLGAIAVGEASEMKDALGQVNAALTSMGSAGGRSLEQLKTQADNLAGSSLFEDDQILRDLTANLLTFGNIAGEQFDRAQQAAVDMASRLKMGLQPAAILVGKALNDPVKGMAALGRAGVQLSASQKATITSMVAAGNAAGAQKILLGELEKQFGGSAQAARDNAPPMVRMSLAFKSMAGDIGTLLLPVVERAASFFEGLTAKFGQLSPEMQKFVVIAGGIAAAIGPVLVVLGAVVTGIGALLPVFGAVAAVMGGPVILAIGAVVLAFLAFKDDIIPVVMGFVATLKEVLGPKIKPLFDALKGAVSAIGEVFSAIFGGGSGSSSAELKVWGRAIASVFGAALDLITGAINIITNVFRALGALLRGDFSAMWGFLWQAVKAAVGSILNAFETLFPGVIGAIRKMVEGVTGWLQGKLFGVLKGVIDKVKGVSDAFFRLYDAVVGHSYVPDMVTEIGQWMAKLDDNMVQPAVRATQTAAEAFETMQQRVSRAMEGLMTDREKLDLDFRRESKELNALLAAGPGKGGIDQKQFGEMQRRLQARHASDSAGMDAEGLSLPDAPALMDVGDLPGVQAINNAVASMNQAISDSRERFADAFAYGIDSALRGDWRGVLESVLEGVFGGSLQDSIKEMGRGLFDAFKGIGGGAGGGFDFGKIGSAISGFFGKLPGFKTGGSFKVGGSGGVDSSLIAFRATPGEMVDIRRPGQKAHGEDQAPRGGSSIVQNFNVRDYDSFRRSSRQIARDTKRSLDR